MRLNYLPQPGMSAGAGVGAGFASLGKTMSDLGQLSLDEKDKKAKATMESERMTLLKNADTRADGELKLGQDKLAFQKEETQAEKLQKAIKSKNMVGAFRAAHPNATKNFSDEELMAWGNDIDKLLPKDRKIDKIDTRVTPQGDKMLTYMEGGVIKEHNMGKVKTDWNESKDKPSSEIPAGHIAVDEHWFNRQKKPITMSKTKDGRAYAKIGDFNQWLSENPITERSQALNLNLDDEDEY